MQIRNIHCDCMHISLAHILCSNNIEIIVDLWNIYALFGNARALYAERLDFQVCSYLCETLHRIRCADKKNGHNEREKKNAVKKPKWLIVCKIKRSISTNLSLSKLVSMIQRISNSIKSHPPNLNNISFDCYAIRYGNRHK